MKLINRFLIIVILILVLIAFIDIDVFFSTLSNYNLSEQILEYNNLQIISTVLEKNEISETEQLLLNAFKSYYSSEALISNYLSKYGILPAFSAIILPIYIGALILWRFKHKLLFLAIFLLIMLPSVILSKINFETKKELYEILEYEQSQELLKYFNSKQN